MATDLRKVFYGAIGAADLKLVSRLLFATPNMAAGVARLSGWTVGRQEFADMAAAVPVHLPDQNAIPCVGYATEFDALSVALLLCIASTGDGDRNTEHTNVARLLISAMPADLFRADTLRDKAFYYLHLAVATKQPQLVTDLLHKGVSAEVEDAAGVRAEDIAAASGDTAIIGVFTDMERQRAAAAATTAAESVAAQNEEAAAEATAASAKPCRIVVSEQHPPADHPAGGHHHQHHHRQQPRLNPRPTSPAKPSNLAVSTTAAQPAAEELSAVPATEQSSAADAAPPNRIDQLKRQLAQQRAPAAQVPKQDVPAADLNTIRDRLAADVQQSLRRAQSLRTPIIINRDEKSAVDDDIQQQQQGVPESVVGEEELEAPVEHIPIITREPRGRVREVKERGHATIPSVFTAAAADTPTSSGASPEAADDTQETKASLSGNDDTIKASHSNDTISNMISQTMAMAVDANVPPKLTDTVSAAGPPPLPPKDNSAAENVRESNEKSEKGGARPLAKQKPSLSDVFTPPAKKPLERYDSIYEKNYKGPVMMLQDDDGAEDRSPSPGKNVHFGNSWRGTLEKHNKFLKGAAVGSLTKSQTELYLEALSSEVPSSFGKLIIHVVNIRGLVLNYARVPENVQIYCVVRGPQQTFQTKPFLFCPQNLYTEIPLHEQFGFDVVDGNATVQVELMVRFEVRKSTKYSPKAMLQRSGGSIRRILNSNSGGSRPGSRFSSVSTRTVDDASSIGGQSSTSMSPVKTVYDDCVCKTKFRLRDIAAKCSATVLDRKWSLEIVEKESKPLGLLARSSSRIYEAKHFLMSKVHRSASTPPKVVPKDGVCEVAESGTIQLQLFYIGNIESVQEQETIPSTVHDAEQWLASKKWHETIWHYGYLSQQGGDVKFWRRRYFTITGAKMEAFHEFSMEYRTTIDLTQLQSVKRLHGGPDTPNYPIKNSFRLTFKHGESIDFYAQSQPDVKKWMRVFQQILDEMPEVPVWMGRVPAADEDATVTPHESKKPLQPKKPRRNVTKPMMGKRQVWDDDGADDTDDGMDNGSGTLGTNRGSLAASDDWKASTPSTRLVVGIFGGRA